MVRFAFKSLFFLVLIASGATGVWYYQTHSSTAQQIRQLEEKAQRLEADKKRLQTIVARLTQEHRVAEVIVTEQKNVVLPGVAQPVLRTSLLFVEVARDGSPLPARQFTIDGNIAHIDAMVVKFDRGFVQDGDALRGHSIALFTRIYGENQAPENGYPIDTPGQIPDIYRGGNTKENTETAEFEKELWQNFWRLADDKAYREEKGVRLAMGQGVWGIFQPDRVYTITTEADGGVSMTTRDMEAIYRQALRQKTP